jgi:succinate-semialdehyde dehydrogenase/glutarate-semialdehyde dehydrogenase
MKLNDSSLLRTQCYINGKWVPGAESMIEISNPATGASLANASEFGLASYIYNQPFQSLALI